MNLQKKNIAANFTGSLWQALMGVIFVPLYIKFIGIESWGLIGFFVTLQAVLGLLDMGINSTLNRELARLSVLPSKEQEMSHLTRTLEVLYWGVAFFVGIVVFSLSPLIAHYWINAGHLSPATIEETLWIMGVVMILQMPIGFYSGGLMGLQKQVLLNLINVGMGTMRSVGAVLVLWLISPTIQAFFIWQIVISAIHVSLLGLSLWRKLPPLGEKAVFKKQLLKGIWRFAAGMTGISTFVLILTQLDKIILSKLIPLEMFGYYMLASFVATSLVLLIVPVFNGIYPRFAQLVSLEDEDGLRRLYHKSCQLMSVLILPVAFVVAFFSYEILLVWTGDPMMAERTHWVASILICGNAFNGLISLPYALQLAYGWTRLSFFKTLIAVILLVPLLFLMTTRYGTIGAATVWCILNMGMVFIEIPIMHRKILRQEKWRWYRQDVGLPLVTVVVVTGLGRFFMSASMSPFVMVLYIVSISLLTLGITAMITPGTRNWLLEQFMRIRLKYRNQTP